MPRPRPAALVAAVLALATVLSVAAPAAAWVPQGRLITVIVQQSPMAGPAPERAVRRVGGEVIARLGIARMVLARVPVRGLSALATTSGILSVTPDSRIRLAGDEGDPLLADDLGSLRNVARIIGADALWAKGLTGKGVDVALIDSGVAPVEGLTRPGSIVNGADLSFESQDRDLRYLDTFGHGTHMASIIGGRDRGTGPVSAAGADQFLGIAPDARIVSIKVADSFGTTDVSQILAAIGWVVEHRRDGDLDIRVLNLSFGTDGVQDYRLDPLAFAVEDAWKKGIVVVVSAGNDGYGSDQLNNPAYDPYIIAVGATTSRGTLRRDDDAVAPYSSVGTDKRRVDVVAPGTSILGLRTPGSNADQRNPGARAGSPARLFRGSGTSQATAVVSGAVALLLQDRPGLKPDQLKALLRRSAFTLTEGDREAQGAGLIDLDRAQRMAAPTDARQTWRASSGTGSLEAARGTLQLDRVGDALKGERTIFGSGLALLDWVLAVVLGTAWQGGSWMGDLWTGACWCAETWAGDGWSGRSWTGGDWSGRSWTSEAWKGRSWTADGWTGGDWNGRSWTTGTWSGDTWSSADWR